MSEDYDVSEDIITSWLATIMTMVVVIGGILSPILLCPTGSIETVAAVVTDKEIIPKYRSVVSTTIGTIPINYPKRYLVRFSLGDEVWGDLVSSDFFSSVKLGDHISIKYNTGYYSHYGGHKIINIWLK